ncbi:MAG: hypothetical protein ACXACP_09835 [Candidatus Hodarchaeales archaeon]|jgi:hypothetical protein
MGACDCQTEEDAYDSADIEYQTAKDEYYDALDDYTDQKDHTKDLKEEWDNLNLDIDISVSISFPPSISISASISLSTLLDAISIQGDWVVSTAAEAIKYGMVIIKKIDMDIKKDIADLKKTERDNCWESLEPCYNGCMVKSSCIKTCSGCGENFCNDCFDPDIESWGY